MPRQGIGEWTEGDDRNADIVTFQTLHDTIVAHKETTGTTLAEQQFDFLTWSGVVDGYADGSHKADSVVDGRMVGTVDTRQSHPVASFHAQRVQFVDISHHRDIHLRSGNLLYAIGFDIMNYDPDAGLGGLIKVIWRALDVYSIDGTRRSKEMADYAVEINNENTQLFSMDSVDETINEGYEAIMAHKDELLRIFK